MTTCEVTALYNEDFDEVLIDHCVLSLFNSALLFYG